MLVQISTNMFLNLRRQARTQQNTHVVGHCCTNMVGCLHAEKNNSLESGTLVRQTNELMQLCFTKIRTYVCDVHTAYILTSDSPENNYRSCCGHGNTRKYEKFHVIQIVFFLNKGTPKTSNMNHVH